MVLNCYSFGEWIKHHCWEVATRNSVNRNIFYVGDGNLAFQWKYWKVFYVQDFSLKLTGIFHVNNFENFSIFMSFFIVKLTGFYYQMIDLSTLFHWFWSLVWTQADFAAMMSSNLRTYKFNRVHFIQPVAKR